MTKCSRNLTKHLQLLKAEQNRIITLHNNGYKIEPEELTSFIQHKKYVTNLLQTEKFAMYSKQVFKSQ